MSIKASSIFSYLEKCSPEELRRISSLCDNPEDLLYIQQLMEEREARKRKAKAANSLLDFTLYTKPDFKVGWANEIIAQELDNIIKPDCPYDRLIIQAPPRTGKLLADSTPVLTTKGWTTHGELKVGDYVFHPSGKAIAVKWVSEKDVADVEVEFYDGSVIKCHRNHEWTVYDRSESSRGWKTYETNYLLSVAVTNGKQKPRARFQLPIRECLEWPEVDLPIHPYFLGMWLGDGKSSDPHLIHHRSDKETIDKIEQICGYKKSCEWVHSSTGVIHSSFAGNGIRTTLRRLNLLENKHIPEIYLRASKQQRLDLLAGLVDSDGTVCKKTGRVLISNINKTLVDGIYDLVMGLGFRCYIKEYEPVLSTSGIQGKNRVYVVGFNPDIEIPTALPRKRTVRLDHVKRRIGIKEVRLAEPEIGHCIQVDSEDGLYLVGRNLIPTHNSEKASRRFPAYALGKYPDLNIIATSYASDLAQRMNRDVQRIIDTPEYREIFPNTCLNSSNVKTSAKGSYIRTSDMFEIVGHKGAYRSAGVGGGITGMGADILLIDDYLKDWTEASSKRVKDMIWEWYNSTAYTRLSPNGKVIIIATRWADDDLIGRLLKQAKEDPKADQWRVVSLPMEYDPESEYIHELDPRTEPGELLFPERFDQKYVNRRKFSLPPKIYVSLYQQKPTVDGGNIFKRNEFKFFSELPEFEFKMLSVDATFTDTAKSDFVAFGIWGVKGKNKYLIEAKKERLNFTGTLQNIYTFIAKHPDLKELIIEAKANGEAIINMLDNDPMIKIPIYAYKPTDSKEARAWAVTPQVSAGQVFLPDVTYERNRGELWVESYLTELTTFPGGAHDDYVDMTTQFLNRVSYLHTGWLESVLASEELDGKNEFSDIARLMGWKTKGMGLGF